MGNMADALREEREVLRRDTPNLTPEQEEAYMYGAETRIYWAENEDCTAKANALFRDGRNDDQATLAEVTKLKQQFPNTWSWVAGGLDPEGRYPDGSTRQGC